MGCPEQPTKTSCGLKAAEYLVEAGLIVIEPCAPQPIKMADKATNVLEVLQPREVKRKGIVDTASFGCLTCGEVVQVVDDFGDLSARIADGS